MKVRTMALGLAGLGASAAIFLVFSARAQQPANALEAELHMVKLQGNVYALLGAGGNIAIQAGSEGVVLVDAGTTEMAPRVLAEIKKISDQPIRQILNTSLRRDHIGGNEILAKAGAYPTGAGPNNPVNAMTGAPALVVGHENMLTRLSAMKGPGALPFPLWPADTYIEEHKDFFWNGEAIQLFHEPNAHTDGDSIVFFRKSDVIATGDVFQTTIYPTIDLENGGSLQGIIDALNHIIDLAVPAEREEGGTMIIPGHGRLCDEYEVVDYRDLLTIIRDRIQDSIKKGLTLDQVKKSQPTYDWDGRWGATAGPWTTEMFVEAAYKSLSSKKQGGSK
jgi:cyclase